MKIRFCILLILFVVSACSNHDLKISDYVDHWEITKTIKTYPNSQLEIDSIENEYKILEGSSFVFIISEKSNPIFKEGKQLEDLYSEREILIDVSNQDSILSSRKRGNSGFYRKLIAMSPDHGINPLKKEDTFELRKLEPGNISIFLKLYDIKIDTAINMKEELILSESVEIKE